MNRKRFPLYIPVYIIFAGVLITAFGCISEKPPGEDSLMSMIVHREGDAFQFHNLKLAINNQALAAAVTTTLERVAQTSVSAGGMELVPVSHAYVFSPESTLLDGFVTLTIYLPNEIVFNETQLKQLYICRLDGSTLAEILPTTVNRTSRSAITHVGRFGKFILARIPSEERSQTQSPTDIRGIVSPAGHQVIVSWEPSPSPGKNTTYRVYWGDKTNAYSFMDEAGSDLFYRLDGLYSDQVVFVTVSATLDGKRESLFSDEMSTIPHFTIEYKNPTPSRMFEPTEVTDTTLRLKWSKNYDDSFQQYLLFRSFDPHVETNGIPTYTFADVDTVTMDEAGLVPNTAYYYRLVVENTHDMTAESSVVSAATAAINQPPAPVWFESPSGITSSAVKLAWDSDTGSDFDFYRIYRSDEAAVETSDSMVAEVTDRDSTVYFDTTLSPGNVYYYRIFTYDTKGLFSGSNTRTITTSDSNYSPPVPSLAASRSSLDQADLSWTQCPDADFSSYTIERDTGSETWADQVTVITDIGTVTYSDTGLDTGITYSYRVKVTDRLGLSSYSAEVTP